MKNKNKILMGCLALLLVLSVGYALFSETITINGTATAKGSFNLTTTCVKGISPIFTSLVDSDYNNHGYEEDFCTVEGTDVFFGAKLLYPTAIRTFVVEIKNTGTIDAVLNPNTGMTMTEGELFYDSNGDNIADTLFDGNYYAFVGMERAIKTDKSGNIITGNSMMDEDGNLKLSVGETMHVFLYVEWPDIVSYDSINGKFMEFSETSLKFDFKQVTN